MTILLCLNHDIFSIISLNLLLPVLEQHKISFNIVMTKACANMLRVCKGAVYICMSSSELDTLQSAFRNSDGKWSTFIIWAKNTFTIKRADYQRQYELIL